MNNLKPECDKMLRELDADEALENAKENVKQACDKLAPLAADPLGMALLSLLDSLDPCAPTSRPADDHSRADHAPRAFDRQPPFNPKR